MNPVRGAERRRERTERFIRSRLYPVISSEFCAGRSPEEVFYAAAAGGAAVIQIREKNMEKSRLCDLVRECRRIADRFGVLLIVDDHADVAAEAGADGVHVGQDDLSVAEVRAISPELLVGRSTHNLPELLAAQREGADYLNIGPIFATGTKNVSYLPVGLEALSGLIPRVTIPFSVMGGIKREHVVPLLKLGVRHIAMVTEVTQAPEIEKRVRELEALFISPK